MEASRALSQAMLIIALSFVIKYSNKKSIIMKNINLTILILMGVIVVGCQTPALIQFPETVDEGKFEVLKGKTDSLQFVYLLKK